jgi:NAD dependent epimerase/dehydratase family.
VLSIKMSISLARAVLIGGTGFIGKAINHELSRIQVPVLSIASNFINLLEPMAEYQLRKVIKKTDSIVMLSALTPKWGKGPDIFTKNIHMLDVVLKVASDINVRHFIYFSSDAVYGIKEGLISESSSLNPVDLYGAMHLSRD